MEPARKKPRLATGYDSGGSSGAAEAGPAWAPDGTPPRPPYPPPTGARGRTFPSPFRLTRVRDLPPAANADAVSLGDILGDPMLSECWSFNYLHDLGFLLSHIDPDIRPWVNIHIVHGFWRREDRNRQALQVWPRPHTALCGPNPIASRLLQAMG